MSIVEQHFFTVETVLGFDEVARFQGNPKGLHVLVYRFESPHISYCHWIVEWKRVEIIWTAGSLTSFVKSWDAKALCLKSQENNTNTFQNATRFFFWILQIMQNKVGTSTTWTARDFAARLAALGWASRTTAGQTGRNGVGLREQWVGTENICIQFVSNVIWFLYIYIYTSFLL